MIHLYLLVSHPVFEILYRIPSPCTALPLVTLSAGAYPFASQGLQLQPFTLPRDAFPEKFLADSEKFLRDQPIFPQKRLQQFSLESSVIMSVMPIDYHNFSTPLTSPMIIPTDPQPILCESPLANFTVNWSKISESLPLQPEKLTDLLLDASWSRELLISDLDQVKNTCPLLNPFPIHRRLSCTTSHSGPRKTPPSLVREYIAPPINFPTFYYNPPWFGEIPEGPTIYVTKRIFLPLVLRFALLCFLLQATTFLQKHASKSYLQRRRHLSTRARRAFFQNQGEHNGVNPKEIPSFKISFALARYHQYNSRIHRSAYLTSPLHVILFKNFLRCLGGVYSDSYNLGEPHQFPPRRHRPSYDTYISTLSGAGWYSLYLFLYAALYVHCLNMFGVYCINTVVTWPQNPDTTMMFNYAIVLGLLLLTTQATLFPTGMFIDILSSSLMMWFFSLYLLPLGISIFGTYIAFLFIATSTVLFPSCTCVVLLFIKFLTDFLFPDAFT